MSKITKNTIRLILILLMLASAVIPFASNTKTSAATWTVNSCYLVNNSAGLALKSSKDSSASTLLTIPNNTYIYVVDINGNTGYTAYNGKYGYVDLTKAIRKDAGPDTVDEVNARLDAIQAYYYTGVVFKGSRDGTSNGAYISNLGGAGPWTCFGFAAEVWRALFGCEMSRSYISNKKYKFASDADMVCVGTLDSNTYDAEKLKNLLIQARPGDIIQGCHVSATSGQHTMVVDYVTNEGICIYDGNIPNGTNQVRKDYFLTWDAMYYERPAGISLYTFVGYPHSEPVSGSAITIKNNSNATASTFMLGDKIKFTSTVQNAQQIVYYVYEATSNQLVKEITIANPSGANTATYTFTALTAGSTKYYVYYVVSNGLGSLTSSKVSFTVNTPTVKINQASLNLVTGDTSALTITKNPSGAGVAWTTSNATVATVSSTGVVTAKAAGTATITATLTYYGNGATIRVNSSITVKVENQQYTVTFDPNGGTVSQKTKVVTKTKTYGTLPTPTKAGYQFVGWYTSKTGGSLIKSNSTVTVTQDVTLYARWTPAQYTVTFNPNTGTVSTTSKTVTYLTTYGTLPTPTKPGYDFVGWFTAASGGTQVTSSTQVKITSAQTLYAHWKAASFKVTFDAAGGKASFSNYNVVYLQKYATMPTAERVGYEFVGWFTAANGGTQIKAGDTATITVNTTLYAHWKANKYNITYDANEGTVDESGKTVDFGSPYSTLPVPVRPGYAFLGWFTQIEGGEKVIASTNVFIASNHTLYAHWEPGSFTVSFDAMGGTTPYNTISVVFLDAYGELPVAVRAGYTFLGWYTDITEGENILPETLVSITADQKLYAHWSVNTYTVSFESNTVESSFDSRKVEFDTVYGELPIPTKRGYEFGGWFLSLDDTTTPITAETILKTDSDHFLYALWIPNKYNITFDVNTGDADVDGITVTFGSPYGEMPLPVKYGYDFIGWYTDSVDGDIRTSETIVDDNFDTILYAHWSPMKIVVKLEGEGGEPSQSEFIVTFDEKLGPLPTAKRTGYTFTGWINEHGYEMFADVLVTSEDPMTFYAQWEANQYTVSFNAAGGTVAGSSIKVTYDDVYPTFVTPSKEGYRFIGWRTAANENVYTGDIVKITSTQTFTAQWVPLVYTVSFNANGGNCETQTKSVAYNTLYGELPSPVKIGYSFMGWYSSSSAQITANSYSTSIGDHMLTAKWVPLQCELFFESNGGSILNDSVLVTYDSKYGALPTPVKDGYRFMSWQTADGVVISEDDTVKITEETRVFATWAPTMYTVTFDGNGSSRVVPPKYVTYNGVYGDFVEPSRSGYIFDGWFDEDGRQVFATDIVKIKHNITLTARWTAIVYDVYLDANGGECAVDHMEFTCDQLYSALPSVTREGYNFTGWMDEYGNIITENVDVKPVIKQTFTATWEPIKCNIYFMVDGKRDTSLTRTISYGERIGILPALDKAGYTFYNWEYEDGEAVLETDVFFSLSDITLYAVVTVDTYTVTFLHNEDESEYSSKVVTYNKTMGELPRIYREGYVFDGWYFKNGELVTEETLVTFNSNMYVYARWIEIPASVTQAFVGDELLVTGFEVFALLNIVLLIFIDRKSKKNAKKLKKNK